MQRKSFIEHIGALRPYVFVENFDWGGVTNLTELPRPKTERGDGTVGTIILFKNIFAEVPKTPAYYCRKDSKKQYQEYDFE